MECALLKFDQFVRFQPGSNAVAGSDFHADLLQSQIRVPTENGIAGVANIECHIASCPDLLMWNSNRRFPDKRAMREDRQFGSSLLRIQKS